MFLPALIFHGSQIHQLPIYVQEQTASRVSLGARHVCMCEWCICACCVFNSPKGCVCVCVCVPLLLRYKSCANILPGNNSCSQSSLFMCQKYLSTKRGETTPMPAQPCALKSAGETTLCLQTANKQTNGENRDPR